jgi:predicted GIY-YIG superfamily endonuclease
VYLQETSDVAEAIAAETRIKGLLRPKKIALIEEENPTWRDLSAES